MAENWQEMQQAADAAFRAEMAAWRNMPVEFFTYLWEHGLLGAVNGRPAFPVHNAQGEVVGAHVRKPDDKNKWGYVWFTQDPEQRKMGLLIIGQLGTAKNVWFLESQWDAFVCMMLMGWHKGGMAGGAIVIVITRGAENGHRIKGMCRPDQIVYAFKQNDGPREDGGQPPADRWMDAVAQHAGCAVRWVKTPAEHKDPNEWLRAGAKTIDLMKATHAGQRTSAVGLRFVFVGDFRQVRGITQRLGLG